MQLLFQLWQFLCAICTTLLQLFSRFFFLRIAFDNVELVLVLWNEFLVVVLACCNCKATAAILSTIYQITLNFDCYSGSESKRF